MPAKVKSTYQKMVFDVVVAEAKKLRKAHPNLKQSEIMSKAWKTPAVLKARKDYAAWKVKQAKKGGCGETKTGGAVKRAVKKKPAAKKPAKKKAPAKKRVAKK